MAKLTTTDFTALTANENSTVSRLNSNFAAVEAAMENTLSLDGTSPNQMEADLDMNSNDILNVGTLYANTIVAAVGESTTITSSSLEFQSIAALRAYTTTAEVTAGSSCRVTSYLVNTRAGGGFYWYDSSDTTTADDGVTCFVDADGRRWKPVSIPRQPSPYETLDLEYFLAKYSTHREALIEAHKALFDPAVGVPMLLECHGIQLQIEQPILLRNADLVFGAGEQTAEKIVSNMHLKAVDDGYTWQTRDFLYSISGSQSQGNLRYFILDKPLFNLNSKSLIACHVSGYYHVTIEKPRVRGMGSTAIGIYSSKYDSDGPGVGRLDDEASQNITAITQANPAVVTVANHGYSTNDTVFIENVGGMVELNDRTIDITVLTANTFELQNTNSTAYTAYTTGGTVARTREKNGNHGMQLIQPDIRGTAALVGGDQIGFYTEDGDTDVQGGWFSFLDEGIVTMRGGLNTEGVHYSMSDRADTTIAVHSYCPRQTSLKGCEMDGCVYVFENSADNMYEEGVPFEGWSQLAFKDFKISGDDNFGGATAGYGLINFITHTANEVITGLTIEPDWGLFTGGDPAMVNFTTTGSGTWNGDGFNNVIFTCTHNNNQNPGDFPAGVRIRIARTGDGATSFGFLMNTDNGAMLYTADGQSGDTPYIRPSAKELIFGRINSSVYTDRWKMNTAGHFVPTTTATYTLGSSSSYVKDLYVSGHVRTGANTATATAGAATLNTSSGIITSEALTTAAGAAYTLTLTNSTVAATDIVVCNITGGTSSAGLPVLMKAVPGSSSIVFTVNNIHSANALNGTLKISYVVIKTS